ncbi:BLOC-1-related complex subunit 7-like [Dugong dugon]
MPVKHPSGASQKTVISIHIRAMRPDEFTKGVTATETSDLQAQFGQPVKGLLTEKVNTWGTDVTAFTKQVLKDSWSSELLAQAAQNTVLQKDATLHSEDSLRDMAIITTHFQYQQEAIQNNAEQSSDLQDQGNHLLKQHSI